LLLTWRRLRLRQELLQRQELISPNVELVPLFEGLRLDALLGLNSEENAVQRSEDLIDLTNRRL